MAKVLITGATGFIGPHLARVLQEAGAHVVCMRRASSNVGRLQELDVEFVTADVTQTNSLPAALRGIDHVLHLAGVVKAFRRADFDRVNVAGTRNLVEAASRQATPPDVIVVSSLAAAGPAAAERHLTESDPARPVSVYGHSKRAGELEAIALADKVPVSIIRPPIVFGEGDRDVFQMFKPIRQHGLHVVAGSPEPPFSFIYAGDLATAITTVAARGERIPAEAATSPTAEAAAGGGIYYAAHQEHPTYVEMGSLIAAALETEKLRVLKMPLALAWMAAAGSELVSRIMRKPSILNFDKIREARAGGWSCSPEKIRKQLGWQPAASLAERLQQTAHWYYEQGWLKRPKQKARAQAKS